MTSSRKLSAISASLLCAHAALAATGLPLPAFPGAEGFGRQACGGRGGEVYHVTTLEDSGPGSLRAAVSRPHRMVIFDVGGYIRLKSILAVSSDITIAGQTAPGAGVGTFGAEVSFSGAHNVIVRYIRFRQGLAEKQDKKSAVNIFGGSEIIFDHVSIEWGRWDTVDMNQSTNITFQNCIIGQGITPQRFGCLCQCDNVTFSHNLFIDNQSRNPKAKGRIQYVNNVVYNWGVCGLVGGHSAADHTLDVIGNYFIQGPGSRGHFIGEFTPTDHVYQSGNFADLSRSGKLTDRPVGPADFGSGGDAPTFMPTNTVLPLLMKVDSAQAAYEKVLTSVGCSLHPDAVDARLIGELESLGQHGQIIHDPVEAGGLGELKTASVPTPPDGVPDMWKTIHQSESNNDGYTPLEHYLNFLAGNPPGR